MDYSIGDVSQILGVNPSTIRYYDKRGLLPFVNRDKTGRRIFKDNDFNFLQVIECMKKSGLKIDQIREFIDMCMKGDMTLKQRYNFLDREEQILMKKIETLQNQLNFLRYKKWYYKTSIEARTEAIHFDQNGNVSQQTQKQYEEELSKCGNIRELIDYHDSSVNNI